VSAEIKAEWLAQQAEKIEQALADGLGFNDVATILKVGMESIEMVRGLDNEEKEAAVVELGCMFIDKTDTPWLPDTLTDPVMKMAWEKWGPGLVKLIVDATKGKLAVNKPAGEDSGAE
jgi:hypothetical protein